MNKLIYAMLYPSPISGKAVKPFLQISESNANKMIGKGKK
jgi:hypothetical protein